MNVNARRVLVFSASVIIDREILGEASNRPSSHKYTEGPGATKLATAEYCQPSCKQFCPVRPCRSAPHLGHKDFAGVEGYVPCVLMRTEGPQHIRPAVETAPPLRQGPPGGEAEALL